MLNLNTLGKRTGRAGPLPRRDLGERLGMRALMCIESFNSLDAASEDGNWNRYPYNRANGGPCGGGGLTSTGGATLTVDNTPVAHNYAQGGQGGAGGNGGNGLGGGLYEDPYSTLNLTGATVSYNFAVGGEAGADHRAIGRFAQKSAGAQRAIESGRFKDEIVPVKVQEKKGERFFSEDEHPRRDTTAEALAKLPPVFSGSGPSVQPGVVS
jgi:hypothetical protein